MAAIEGDKKDGAVRIRDATTAFYGCCVDNVPP